MRLSKLILIMLTMLAFLTSCEKERPMTWSRAEHYYGGSTGYLTLNELIGPKGATANKIIPGKYIAKGTYDLTGSQFTTGEINLGFRGSSSLGRGGKSYIIPEGQLTGSYEVMEELSKLESGPGNPHVDFMVAHTMHDSITLY
jgi:hypothetical protein